MLKLAVLAVTLCFAAGQLAGGWMPGTIAEVSELALWSTQKMSQLSGFEGEYTIQTPKKVFKQIVNGVNYKFDLDVVVRGADNKYNFKTCSLYIYDQSWTNTRYFVQAPVCTAQQVRSSVGTWTPVTAITDEILDVARLSAKAMNSQLGFEGEHNVAKVFNVETQIVSGINYKFDVEFLVALPNNKYELKTCAMQINYQAWNQNKISFLTTPVCKPTQVRDMFVGGWQETNVITDEMMSLANWATTSLSAYTGVTGEHQVLTLRKVATQVVSGVNYRFTLDVLAKDASNGKYFFKSCDMVINYKAWDNTKSFVGEPTCGAHPNFQ